MVELTTEIILGIVVVLIIIFFLVPKIEKFDKNTVMFVPVGEKRYDLRGEYKVSSPYEQIYMKPNRQVRIHHTSNPMYISDESPPQEGRKGCKLIPCPPNNNEYDQYDTCWDCSAPHIGQPLPHIISDKSSNCAVLHKHVPDIHNH